MNSKNIGGALRPVLFFYEILRLLLLLVSVFIVSLENHENMAFFPYPVYLSANALFPLMALFIWLKPGEHRNYLNLYMAGKIIGVISFYAWEFFSARGRASVYGAGFLEFSGADTAAKSVVLLGGSVFLSLADVLSAWGAWSLINKYRKGGA